ncbi:hypothetical protein MRX96_003931 [Rhipicephalus microplus]
MADGHRSCCSRRIYRLGSESPIAGNALSAPRHLSAQQAPSIACRRTEAAFGWSGNAETPPTLMGIKMIRFGQINQLPFNDCSGLSRLFLIAGDMWSPSLSHTAHINDLRLALTAEALVSEIFFTKTRVRERPSLKPVRVKIKELFAEAAC